MHKKGLFILATSASLLFANQYKDWYLTVEPFVTFLNYSNSKLKKTGISATLYGSLSLNYGTHIFEAAVGNTHLNYRNGFSDWNQSDYTLAYTNYQLFPWYGKIGFHYIATPNTHFSEKAKIYFLDVGYIKKYTWNGGLFISYSDYKRSIVATQTQLHGGFYHWFDYYTGLYIGGDLRWIKLSDANKLNSVNDIAKLTKDNYYSAGINLTYFNYKYSLILKGWIGERILSVDNGGFVVYNLKEKYNGGASLGVTYYFKSNLWVKAEVGYSTYKESYSGRNVDVLSSTLSIGYSF